MMESIIALILIGIIVFTIFQRLKEKDQEDFEDRDS